MTNKNIFCNTPWYELHIYQDGSLGICCQEDHKLYSGKQQYNIATTSIDEWFNSKPVRDFRLQVLGNKKTSACKQCYIEEEAGGHSRRLRSNQKSVIFTRTAFDESYQQSPGYPDFTFSSKNKGKTKTHPIDLHIDLGNYCNLACKMCNASASSTIAAQEVKWGIEDSRKYVGTDWTSDEQVWNNFKQQLLDIPHLNNVHFMGGETLLTDRFEDFVDFMIEHKRFDLCFSFVTNGTTFNPTLLDKLKQFRRVGLEISIEAVSDHNAYQRQGTDTKQVLKNITKYMKYANGSNITVSLRPAPSALTIGSHVGLLQYCVTNKLLVKSNLVYSPRFLDPRILPKDIREVYQKRYELFLKQFDDVDTIGDYNFSDPNNYRRVIRHQAEMCLALLNESTPDDSAEQLEKMVRHCERWDREYGYDARLIYPEWSNLLDTYGYTLSK